MSKKEKVTETPVKEQKVVTKYDRKVQKRKEQAALDLKEKKRARIINTVILVLVICFIAFFPIRSYMERNEAFVEIGGEKITRVEFDTYYGLAVSSFNDQYGSYLSMMGLDLTADLSTIMYSDTMTWKDFFQQMTVENIKQNKAVLKDAATEGYKFDVTDRWNEYRGMIKDLADQTGLSVNGYIKEAFGPYAKLSRIEDTIKETLFVSAYLQKLMEEKDPSDEEIEGIYERNKDEYDAVDFRMTQIIAELPTEPTELADPVEKKEESTESTEDEEEYEPSEAEIEAAMKEAKAKADAAEKTIAQDGELREEYSKTIINELFRDWMFDASRKTGDTTVVEDSENHRYYVLAFEKRYRLEEPTANARVIYTAEGDGQAILDEWKNGPATEESFIELFKKYSDDQYSTENGLYANVSAGYINSEMAAWIFEEGRKEGDTTAIVVEDGGDYVVYFKGLGDPEWKLNIRNALINTYVSDRLSSLIEEMEVMDPKGNLPYLTIETAE